MKTCDKCGVNEIEYLKQHDGSIRTCLFGIFTQYDPAFDKPGRQAECNDFRVSLELCDFCVVSVGETVLGELAKTVKLTRPVKNR